MEMEKAQGDKVGVLLLAKGRASPSWIAFLLPPAHVGFREEVGISAPTGDSVSPLPQRKPSLKHIMVVVAVIIIIKTLVGVP